MKKLTGWLILVLMASLAAGCLFIERSMEHSVPTPWVITRVVTATPLPGLPSEPTIRPGGGKGPIVIATALRLEPTQAPTQPPSATPTPAPTATPTPVPTDTPWSSHDPTPVPLGNEPTPIPDYMPGQGMAVLMGESPYELSILRGGWQAYQIGPSANEWGYLVDITPLQPAVEGAYVEYKILPEYFAGQWVDVLWLRPPGISDFLPVRLDLIPTKGWTLAYEADVRLTPGDWMGFGMFSNGEGCGGVLDISPANTDQAAQGAYIANTRVQPEFPGNWVQVIRVALSNEAVSQQAWLRYYSPGPLAQEVLRQEASLPAGLWSGWVVADSQASQGYVVEVIPLKNSDNEVAGSVVRPEFSGTKWEDVLRVYVPEGRPVLQALLRVLAVPVE